MLLYVLYVKFFSGQVKEKKLTVNPAGAGTRMLMLNLTKIKTFVNPGSRGLGRTYATETRRATTLQRCGWTR